MHRNALYVPGSDGTPIAWHAEGDGPVIAFVNGFSTSNFFWRYLYPALQGRARLVTWDYKGHGDSAPARTAEGCTMPAMVEDLRRVLDAAEVERATLIGFSMGCQVVYEAWRHIPDRLSGLVPVLGPAGQVLDTLLRPVVGPLIHGGMRTLSPVALNRTLRLVRGLMALPVHYPLGRAIGLIGPGAPRPDIKRYIDHFAKVDPESIRRIALNANAHSAEDLLPSIAVPTLVVVGGKDSFCPPRTGVGAQQRIPGSELLYLPEATHTGLFEVPEALNGGVIDFLARHGLVAG
ncbi:MAG: alpha/beta hydrolase [Myxococcales bacterium]|nr:alpha/beta hydrolase [Myxococcales bacterium]MCB9525493.1 alpha/beta hydrolase [Myxococcales bacterium]